MNVFETKSLVKRFGELLVTDSVSIDVRPGELHAVIGPNGAGKTTLINQLSGELASNGGRIYFEGQEITEQPIRLRAQRGLLRSYQITSILEEFTVLENAALAALASKSSVWTFWRPLLGDLAVLSAARDAVAAAGLSDHSGVLAGELAYGQRRQLELAMVLSAKPKLLLLDEPMAGMSVQESAAVLDLLRDLKKRYAILLVEHDMEAVFSLADRITVMVYGRVMFTGTVDEVRAHPEIKAVYLGEEEIGGS